MVVRYRSALALATCIALAISPFTSAFAGISNDPYEAPANYVAAEQTPVTVVLDQDLKSGDSVEGQDVVFHTKTDLQSSGHVLLIPAGARAWGVVRQSTGHGLFGKSGKLDFSCDYVVAPNGARVPLRSQSMAVHGKDNTTSLVGGLLVLGVFGGLVKGRDVNVHAGTEFTMYVDTNTPLPAVPSTMTASYQPPAIIPDIAALLGDGNSNGAAIGRAIGLGQPQP